MQSGYFEDEIVPVTIPGTRKTPEIVFDSLKLRTFYLDNIWADKAYYDSVQLVRCLLEPIDSQ